MLATDSKHELNVNFLLVLLLNYDVEFTDCPLNVSFSPKSLTLNCVKCKMTSC